MSLSGDSLNINSVHSNLGVRKPYTSYACGRIQLPASARLVGLGFKIAKIDSRPLTYGRHAE